MVFKTTGNKSNSVILFFHAMGVTGESSMPVAEKMAEKYYCIMPTSTVYCSGQRYQSKRDEIQQIVRFLGNHGIKEIELIVASSIGADLAMAFLTEIKIPVKHVFFDGGQFAQIGKVTRRIMVPILKSRLDKNGELKSSDSFASIELYGTSACKKVQDTEFCECFHLENESGTGMITLYHVFPGIDLVYNDMHMEYCNKEQKPASSVMEINYCMEGRCECVFEQNEYGYIAAGDLSFCSLKKTGHVSEFPTSRYHGITITLDFSMITDEMKRILQLLSVNLEKISNISKTHSFTIIRANQSIEHIFLELYKVPEEIRYGYIRVKILELLLVLTGFDLKKNNSEHVYFSDVQIDAIKQVHAFLKGHYRGHYTIEELSVRFKMSPTVLKKCFKGVYGNSVYAYMKKYRLQMAERLLKENKLTIGEIALQIGYQNPNKFTSAFRTEYGMTPTEYRKKKTQESLNG